MDDDRFRPPFGFSSGFFGPHRRSPPMNPFDDEDTDESYESFGEDLFSRFRFGNFGRNNNDMDDVFRGAETMLRHLDSMFRDMHSFGGDGVFGQIMGPGISDDRSDGRRRSPRDEMLKEPESDSVVMVLNPDAEEDDVDAKSEMIPQGQPRGWSSWSGMSSTTSFSGFGDGKTEEKRTIQNGDGSKSVIVTRRMGEKEWTVTTKTNRNGETEVMEDLVNMDESDIKDFDAGWRFAGPPRYLEDGGGKNKPEDRQTTPPTPLLDRHAPNIFSKLFGSWFK